MRYSLITLTGLIGALLLIITYYLLWIDPQTELEDVIIRTRMAIITSMVGSILSVYYMFMKNR
ncbi:MAG: hypothetical protein JSW20_00285 [Nitrospiraceae bacterium]|nr:MAG: hypothetical protein JSW20_00285 [Nitrospiraceae bacterium]